MVIDHGARARRLLRLSLGVAEHGLAALAGLGGRRYFDSLRFDRVYASGDPWQYATSSYEAARREALLAALPQPRYARVLEVGCGEGFTTRRLAERASHVVGLDASGAALARARHGGLPPNVTLVDGDLLGEGPPLEAPRGAFDLVVCAEVLYYCYTLPVGAACRRVRDRLLGWLAPGGDLVLMHPLHFPLHWPFDRLAGPRARGGAGPRGPALARLARSRVALAPRPVTVAVYRREGGSRQRPGEPTEVS